MTSKIFFGENPNPTNVNDLIEFNISPVATGNGYIMNTSYRLTKIDTTVTDPNPANMGNFQDTGNDIVEITLTGLIINNDNREQARKNMRTFMLRDHTDTSHPAGMVGLRLDRFDDFNITPSSSRGARIMSMELAEPINEPTKIGFVAIIRIFGNRGTSPGYSWS